MKYFHYSELRRNFAIVINAQKQLVKKMSSVLKSFFCFWKGFGIYFLQQTMIKFFLQSQFFGLTRFHSPHSSICYTTSFPLGWPFMKSMGRISKPIVSLNAPFNASTNILTEYFHQQSLFALI